jgi:L-lactate dehydrogenase complex protein LldG
MTKSILESVRHSLGRTDHSPLGQRPAIYESRRPGPNDSEIEQFLLELKKLSGVGRKLSRVEIEPAFNNLVNEQNIRKATMWNTSFLRQLNIPDRLHALGVELVSPNADKNEMAKCDLGITEADFILPETGTIGLLSSAEKPRAVSLLPRVHLAVVTPAALRADMHQVFAEAKSSHYLVLITGPSRTADIELNVTLGVHGPKDLHVWMMDV